MIRTRFAPSPTGDLHLGGAFVALASWILARRAGGAFVVRVEDLDTPRVVAGAEARIAEDLAWLGLDADEENAASGKFGPYAQSSRTHIYENVLAHLTELGVTYPCDCSRAEIAKVASAPHAGEEHVYPGLCRSKDPGRPMKRPPALRLRVAETGQDFIFVDDAAGETRQNIARAVGDFVLRRGDGMFAYQLAVIVDDTAMAITHVVRGADLLASTPRQLLLANLLDAPAPRYAHLPLVVGPDGERLAKRTQGARVRALRTSGMAADDVIGALGHALGFSESPAPISALALADIARSRPIAWPKAPWAVPAAWADAAGV
jgi:glutamyl-tRNA synthetase